MKNVQNREAPQPTTPQRAPGQRASRTSVEPRADKADRERAENEGMIAAGSVPPQAPTYPVAGGGSAAAGAPPGTAVEGEGSYTATQRYREALKRSIEEGAIDRLAKEAAAAVDGPEGPDLRAAEAAAKRGVSN